VDDGFERLGPGGVESGLASEGLEHDKCVGGFGSECEPLDNTCFEHAWRDHLVALGIVLQQEWDPSPTTFGTDIDQLDGGAGVLCELGLDQGGGPGVAINLCIDNRCGGKPGDVVLHAGAGTGNETLVGVGKIAEVDRSIGEHPVVGWPWRAEEAFALGVEAGGNEVRIGGAVRFGVGTSVRIGFRICIGGSMAIVAGEFSTRVHAVRLLANVARGWDSVVLATWERE